MRIRKDAVSVLVVLAVPLGLFACGDSDEPSGAEGGELQAAIAAQPDSLDPALSYTVEAWQSMWLVYTPLLTYRHAEGTTGSELIPGLAEDLPEVSEDGLTYTLQLRDGLVYSDGSPVVASDFEHTIKRVLNLESGGAPFYQLIEGGTEFLEGGDPEADITGIKTDDETGEIEIMLTKADSSFSNVLAMNFAGLVPGDTPFKNLTDEPPPGVGPYMITESVPNREFVMEKNPDFAALAIPDIPLGHVAKITTEVVPNFQKATQDVIDNKFDYLVGPPVPDLVPTIEAEAPERYQAIAAASTYYWFLNTRVPPFDDPLVREAVNYGVDRPAFSRLSSGRITPGCAFLPPGFPGYDEAFDTTECPYGDPSEPPDLAKAQDLLRQAGADGAEVTVWGIDLDPTDKATQAYADMLSQIGFDVEVELLNGGVYFQSVGNQKTAAQTGFANWFADFPHPLNFYFLMDGATIQPTNNQNFGNIDDPKINDEIARLRASTETATAHADEWAALDRYLVEPSQSYIAPFGHGSNTTFTSERVDFDQVVAHPLYADDYTSFQLVDE